MAGGKNNLVVQLTERILINQNFRPTFSLGRSFPKVSTLVDGIEYLRTTTTGLITGNTGAYFINLPSRKILNYLEAALQRNNPEWTRLPAYIPNFFAYRSDFSDTIFLSPEELYVHLANDSKFDTNINLKRGEGIYTPKLLTFENQIFLYI